MEPECRAAYQRHHGPPNVSPLNITCRDASELIAPSVDLDLRHSQVFPTEVTERLGTNHICHVLAEFLTLKSHP